MKPIRDYSEGQWLLLLWVLIVLFLAAGVAFSRPVLVVAIIAAIGAAYTTYLYVSERVGRSPTGTASDQHAFDPQTGGPRVGGDSEPPRDTPGGSSEGSTA